MAGWGQLGRLGATRAQRGRWRRRLTGRADGPAARLTGPTRLTRFTRLAVGMALVAGVVGGVATEASATGLLCQTITGTVRDVYQVPIVGARTYWTEGENCGNGTVYTDSLGRYTAMVTPTTRVGVSVSKTRYVSESTSFTYQALNPNAYDITMKYTLNVSRSPMFLRPGDAVTVTGVTGAPPSRSTTTYLCSWGDNSIGQLGSGANGGTRSTPAPVVGSAGAGTMLTDVRTVVSSYVFSLALLEDGTVWGWGQNGDGVLGDRQGPSYSTVPVQIKGVGGAGFLTGVTSIAAGDRHALAVLSDGTVVAWGANLSGQLGNAWSPTYPRYPTRVLGPGGTGLLSGITDVAAGSSHSAARKSDGTVWGWGNGWYNGTDNGNDVVYYPWQVRGVLFNDLENVTAIAAAGNHTVALRSDGSVVGWGNNADGEVGNGTSTYQRYPREVVDENGVALTGVDKIAAGARHSLARKTDGTLLAWGSNGSGQLGTATGSSNKANPVVRSDTSTPLVVASMAGGGSHTVASLLDGTVMTWGDNSYSQLARSTSSRSVLRAVSPGGSGYLSGVSSVAAGLQHTLAVRKLPCDSPQSTTRLQIQVGPLVVPMTPGTTGADGITPWTGTFTVPAGTPDGQHWFGVCAVDVAYAGTCSAVTALGAPAVVATQFTLDYRVDTTPPRVYLTSPLRSASTLNRGTISVSWTDNQVGVDPATITMTLDGQPVTPTISGGTASISGANVPAGIHEVQSTAKDKLGNGPATYTFLFTFATITQVGAPAKAQLKTTPAIPTNTTATVGPSTVTIPNVTVNVSEFSETLNASTRAGKGPVKRPFTLGTVTARFNNAAGALQDVNVTIGAKNDVHNIAVLAPSAEPLSIFVAAHSTVIGSVTVEVPPLYRTPGTGATVQLLGGEEADLQAVVEDPAGFLGSPLTGKVPVVGAMRACFAGRGDTPTPPSPAPNPTALNDCRFDQSATAYIPPTAGTPVPSSVGVPTAPAPDGVTNDQNEPTCYDACEQPAYLRRMPMSVSFECPSIVRPGSAELVNLCSQLPVEVPTAPSAWRAHAYVWLFEQTGGAGYPVWQQDHAIPGQMPCPNGKTTGAVIGSTYRLVANTTDLDKYGIEQYVGGTGPSLDAPVEGGQYVYLGPDTGNSMMGTFETPLGFQLSNDPRGPKPGSNAPLHVKAEGYFGPYRGFNMDGAGGFTSSEDSSGNWIPAADATNYWEKGQDPVATDTGETGLIQLHMGTAYDTGWQVGDAPAHYGITAGIDYQAVLDYSTCA